MLRDPADKKPTKMPFNPDGRGKAMADKPATWGTRAQAEAHAATLDKPYGVGGIGLEFAELDDGRSSCGIDLDDCRDPETGVIEVWADEIINRFASYTEISPSKTGVKIFMLVATADAPALREAMGKTTAGKLKYSRLWKWPGNDHPAGFELHLGNRYFAVTDDMLDGSTDELREVVATDIRHLIEVAGPAFVASAPKPPPDLSLVHMIDGMGKRQSRKATLLTAEKSKASADNSRSAVAFRVACKLRRKGCTYDALCEALKADPATSEWYAEKGEANGGRELQNLWSATDPASGDLILNPAAPLNSAKSYVLRKQTHDGTRTMHHQNATFYTWKRSHYVERATEEMRAVFYRFLDGAKRMDEERGKVDFDPNKTKVANVLEALAAEVQLPGKVRPPAWLGQTAQICAVVRPPASEIIACANGLLHLPTGTMHPHSPQFFSLNALDFDYWPAAPAAAEWLKFLGTIWPNDPQSIDTLQELFGLLLTADTRHQKAFLLVGPKRSGKGTIARVLTQLLGPDNVCGPTLASLGTNFGIAPLIGKRMALVSDARLGGKTDPQVIVERILSITGEDALTIDRKFRDGWTGKLDARFVILTNELPRLKDSSGALAGRFVILKLKESFYGKEDMELGAKLTPELPSILLWAIDGWKRLAQRKYFITPDSAKDAQQELEELGSPVGAFLRDRCEIGQGKSVEIDAIYNAWCEWCREQGRDHFGTVNGLGSDLSAAVAGLKRRQPRVEGGRVRVYEGVGLKPLLSEYRNSDEAAEVVARVGTRSTPLQPYPSEDPDDPGWSPMDAIPHYNFLPA